MKEIIDKLCCSYENAVSHRICENIISKFENEETKNKVSNTVFNTQMIKINPSCVNWNQIDSKISEIISKNMPNYISLARETVKLFPYNSFQDDGYSVCKFNKNNGYTNASTNFNWNDMRGVAILSVLIFVNTVDEGGEIEFVGGKTIKPKQGDMVVFPCSWDVIWKHHIPISSDSYVISTTLYYKH